MEELEFSLTLDETNKILAALSQQPYVQVYQLVHKLQTQASAQLQQNNVGALFNPPATS